MLTGNDRRTYLHGLLTNDIAALAPGTGCYAALLTPQGRMVSDMRVSELGDAVLIDLPASTAGAVRQRLEDFIFSEDVQVQDVSESTAHVAVYGPRAARILESVLGSPGLPELAPDANVRIGHPGKTIVIIRSTDFGVDGFEIFAERSYAAELNPAIETAGAARLEPATVEVTRVEAGIPAFGTDMDEHTIPLEAGIEDRAISLTKGCYVGQEVIIRVLHRGQGRVARRLVGLIGEPAQRVLARGERLIANDDTSRDVGMVTSAVLSPRAGRPLALGYVHREFAVRDVVLRAGERGDAVTVETLPFTIPAPG